MYPKHANGVLSHGSAILEAAELLHYEEFIGAVRAGKAAR